MNITDEQFCSAYIRSFPLYGGKETTETKTGYTSLILGLTYIITSHYD